MLRSVIHCAATAGIYFGMTNVGHCEPSIALSTALLLHPTIHPDAVSDKLGAVARKVSKRGQS